MGYPVTSQFVCHDFPRLVSMTPNQAAEKPPGGPRISALL